LTGSKDLGLEFADPLVVENNVTKGELGRVLEHLGYNFCRLTKNSFSYATAQEVIYQHGRYLEFI
jgi:hypothetical protein